MWKYLVLCGFLFCHWSINVRSQESFVNRLCFVMWTWSIFSFSWTSIEVNIAMCYSKCCLTLKVICDHCMPFCQMTPVHLELAKIYSFKQQEAILMVAKLLCKCFCWGIQYESLKEKPSCSAHIIYDALPFSRKLLHFFGLFWKQGKCNM